MPALFFLHVSRQSFPRSRNVALPALVLLLLLAGGPSAGQEESLDIVYAEQERLSGDSLLLDIIRLPGSGYIAVGERGHVVRSADGVTWKQAEIVPTRSTLTTIAMGGSRLWAAGHDSVIITSGDQGKTWTQQFFQPDRQQPIMDLYFFDGQHGVAIGAYGLALHTTDGGMSWVDGMINEEEWHNNALLDLGDGRLLVAGEAGFTYRSTNGGETWETIEMPYPGSMFGIIPSGGDCVIVFGLRGHVQESCDFGDTWAELDTGTESTIAGATRMGSTSIFVGNSGLVLTREDGGPFEAHHHTSGVDFAAVVPAGDGRYLLVGEDGSHQYPEAGDAAVD